MKWIKKVLGIKEAPHVFARVDQDHPFSGMDHFSELNDYPQAICINDVTMEEARRELCGKVLNWDLITVKQRGDLKNKRLNLSLNELKGLFR
jgi:hypothetical protein